MKGIPTQTQLTIACVASFLAIPLSFSNAACNFAIPRLVGAAFRSCLLACHSLLATC